MHKTKKILAVIPARGGSKGIKKKNIYPLGGKPLIEYTIETAKKVSLIDSLIVSSDCDEIINVAKDLDCNFIKRPKNISSDISSTEECLLHAVEFYENKSITFDYIVVLEPTSPFRKAESIRNMIKLIIQNEANSILSVKRTYSNFGEVVNGYFKPFIKNAPRRRQERKPFFIESSTIYVACIKFLKKHKTLVSKEWMSYEITDMESIDINTQIDMDFCESILNKGE